MGRNKIGFNSIKIMSVANWKKLKDIYFYDNELFLDEILNVFFWDFPEHNWIDFRRNKV